MKDTEKEYILMVMYPSIHGLLKRIEPFALDTIGNVDQSYRTVAVKAFNEVKDELKLMNNRLQFLLSRNE